MENTMTKSSVELMQKAAGYMLAASNATKRESSQKSTTKTITTTKTNTTKNSKKK